MAWGTKSASWHQPELFGEDTLVPAKVPNAELDAFVETKRKKAMGDTYYLRIRAEILNSLLEYAYYGVPVGGFLEAVLANDLRDAVARADQENARALKEIVMFVYMELPAPCWGSRASVVAWLKNFERT